MIMKNMHSTTASKMENSVWDDKKILFFPLSFQIWQFHSEGAGTLQIQHSFVGMKDASKLVGVQYSWRNKLQFGRAVWQANNLNGFRPLGIQSMANQWASVAANVMTAETCFPDMKMDIIFTQQPRENGKPYSGEITGKSLTWPKIRNGERY